MISEKENHAQLKNRRGSKTYMKSNHDVSDYLVDLPWKCALPEFPTSPHWYWRWLEYLESAGERECHRQGPTWTRYRTDPYSSPTSRRLLFLSFHADDDDEPKGLRPCSILSWLLNRWSILHGNISRERNNNKRTKRTRNSKVRKSESRSVQQIKLHLIDLIPLNPHNTNNLTIAG